MRKKKVGFIGTITKEDTERGHMQIPHHCDCDHCGIGRDFEIVNVPFRLLPQDVGKRVYRVGDGDIIQVENNEQRDERLAAQAEAARNIHKDPQYNNLNRGRTERL